jgi:S-adenosylmethionine:tRNA ribosyltransferase-isomerase
MLLSDFEFPLPAGLIAQEAIVPRDACRLMVVDRRHRRVGHHVFRELPELLLPGDCVVLNETRVLPARLHGQIQTAASGRAELLLLRPVDGDLTWEALVKPGRRLRPGVTIALEANAAGSHRDGTGDGSTVPVTATIVARDEGGKATVRFGGVDAPDLRRYLWRAGEMPTPPYIKQRLTDQEQYQTVYSRVEGSVASPTAGLHFTSSLLNALVARSITPVKILLHVGYGTFAPLRSETVAANRMDAEYYEVPPAAAATINACRGRGGRVFAVGTSVTRTLESVVDDAGIIHAQSGWSATFIYPGFQLRALDGLVTNFHLPRSSPLLLTAAVAGWDLLEPAYAEAIRFGYRFYSFGDGMLVR